ncbi:beta-galactosidase [Pedobacter nyackensis]|uniref:Beta-galactosidase n=1 Tax=Pedobacter nyackensis TaxID=475255 RepID=A0A1W2EUU7_9SPHI|nr:beta-galactosidase [Pedobacter nyackensis]SMD12938.1 Beta-galactosidase [Pedobacter nyackensis]
MNFIKANILIPILISLSVNCFCCKKKQISPTLPTKETKIDSDTLSLKSIRFSDLLGVNGFEWEYTFDNSNNLDPNKVDLINSFTGFRQYLDWEKIEPKEGFYDMGFYDEIYRKNKELGITTLVCLQIMPTWMRKSYPSYNTTDPYSSLRDYTPVPNGSNKNLPASYIAMAKVGFQIAARYGENKSIDRNLVKVAPYEQNAPKVGLGILKYLECSNEPDKDWRGPNAQQTPEQYAAHLSAFYDGHMGTLGADVGVKTADPTMKVVMAGIADPNPAFVKRMIEWCKINRVKDGKYSLCFDVINYHHYSNENWQKGKAPELSDVGLVADNFIKLSKAHANDTDIWVTECGFDVNPKSIQAVASIANKTTRQTQADWILRTSLLYARKGIKRTFFYMLNDVNLNDPTQYASAGLIEKGERRISGDYIYQAKKLMSNYVYVSTTSNDPIVDLYTNGLKKMYVLTVPDQKDRKTTHTLNIGKEVKEVTLYRPQAGSNEMSSQKVAVNDKLVINVTETPTFVKIE